MGSEEGKDRGEKRDIVNGRARVLGCEVDVALVDCDQDVCTDSHDGIQQVSSEVGRC